MHSVIGAESVLNCVPLGRSVSLPLLLPFDGRLRAGANPRPRGLWRGKDFARTPHHFRIAFHSSEYKVLLSALPHNFPSQSNLEPKSSIRTFFVYVTNSKYDDVTLELGGLARCSTDSNQLHDRGDRRGEAPPISGGNSESKALLDW